MKTISQSIRRHLLLHFENQRCNHSSSRLEPEWSGVYCLEGVPGKWGEAAGGGRKPLQMPHLPCSQSLFPSPDPLHPPPGPMLGKVSHGKMASKPNQTL